jgi:hypothetical protein
MVEAMNGTVDEVIRVAEAEGIDADIHRTDELMVATKPAQVGRMRAEVAHRRALGRGRPRPRSGRRGLRARVASPARWGDGGDRRGAGAAGQAGAGLARAVERRGVRICEGHDGHRHRPGRWTSPTGAPCAPR